MEGQAFYKKCQIIKDHELIKYVELTENNLNQDNIELLNTLQNELQLIRDKQIQYENTITLKNNTVLRNR